jgi:hypothetical protein
MANWAPWFLKGLIMGLIGAGINQCILMWGLRRIKILPEEKTKNTLIKCYLIRYFINIGVLFLAYFLTNEMFFLIGTAFGLTLPKNVYILKSLKNRA